jgi:hypothetical protein
MHRRPVAERGVDIVIRVIVIAANVTPNCAVAAAELADPDLVARVYLVTPPIASTLLHDGPDLHLEPQRDEDAVQVEIAALEDRRKQRRILGRAGGVGVPMVAIAAEDAA